MHPHDLPHPSPPLSSGPADRARIALLDHHAEPDWLVAKLAEASPAIVQRARAELQTAGHIPARDPELSADAWTPSTGRPPPPPELRAGLCVGHPQPDLWTSSARTERAEAKAICQRCPVQQACLSWSLSLGVHDDPLSIYGGLGIKARQAARREAGRYLPGSAQAGPRTRCGSCGRALAGDNLVIVHSAGRPDERACRWCRRKAARESARRRRERERLA